MNRQTDDDRASLYPTLRLRMPERGKPCHAGLITITRGMERGTCMCTKAAVWSCECVNGIVGTQRRVEKGPN